MIRKTAYAAMMAGLLAGTAYAQTAPQSQPAPAGSPMQTQTAPATQPGSAGALSGENALAGKWRTSKLVGVDIYGPNNAEVGEVNEVIVDRSGRITHVAISVGGFLGIGAKDVAVPFEQVTWSDQPMNTGSAARTSAERPAGAPAPTGTAGGTQAPAAVAPGTAAAPVPGAPGRTTAPADGMSTASLPARTGDAEIRTYPNHGRITLTREQLEAAPAIKYPD